MTTIVETTNDRRAARALPRIFVGLGVLAVAVLFVLVSPLMDQDDAVTMHDTASVDLGLPMAWVHQDQSAYDPSLPVQLGSASPWENPTSISLGEFVADVVMVFAVLAVAVLVVWLVVAALGKLVSLRGV